MKTVMTATFLLALTFASGAEAAPRARVRDVVIHAGWTWGQGPSETFTRTLTEEVDEGLAACAAGQDLRLDLKIERLNVRHLGDIDLNRPNRLVAQVKVRRASDKAVIDLQRIDVQTPDEGLMAAVRDPELILAEATGRAICRTFFAAPAA
ncbi:hypothetical protein [Caulobacter segnis]|uniref:Uncharacterized protein n=1 Tax=Caulobacter segnis TaxID=88688 RepID=A0A2W5VFY2_9CAUL|nr:hypothetical protein [Caulobacter segnis]PZR36773.1 MAG: hypothetical protein DI526_02180 [Caulobacter segnis]